MHIPKSPTTDIEVISFLDALNSANSVSFEYDTSKWMYYPAFYSEYRYVLGTVGKKPLICVGINPSTAMPDALDNTLKSVERIALNNGFDSFIMFNVYAQRATSPDDMEFEMNEYLHSENMKAFEYILSHSETPCVWAAWGTIIEKRSYLKNCLNDMIKIGKKYSVRWVSSGKRSQKRGHPHHPLYLPKDSALDDFLIDEYISLL